MLFFSLFRDFLRPCEALCQMKKQQIKIKCWIWCLRTVYYNMQCAKIIFQKIPPSYSRALWDCHVLARELTDQFKKITKSCQSKIDSFYSKTSLNQSPDIISALSHKAYTISALSRKAESNSALSRKAESISERSQTDYLLLS